jgi:carbon storage regulator
MIDDDIKIKVLGIRGNQIRIGIEAPDDVVIVREELLEKD